MRAERRVCPVSTHGCLFPLRAAHSQLCSILRLSPTGRSDAADKVAGLGSRCLCGFDSGLCLSPREEVKELGPLFLWTGGSWVEVGQVSRCGRAEGGEESGRLVHSGGSSPPEVGALGFRACGAMVTGCREAVTCQ